MMNQQAKSLLTGFLRSAERFPNCPALDVEKREYSYLALLNAAASYAAALGAHGEEEAPPYTAILAGRSFTAFAGVVAALMRGHGYVPLSGSHPPERNELIVRESGCRAIIADAESSKGLPEILHGIDATFVILIPDIEDVTALRERLRAHIVLGARDLVNAPSYTPRAVSPDAVAYIIFTSGSTGRPKGVMVAHRNIIPYVEFAADRYEVTEEDRFSHTFGMTFDGSLIDMFISWERGACVCCPSQKELLNPGAFINSHRLTLWASVPSIAVFMKRLGSLKRGNFPSLRLSLFGAESLSAEIVASWSAAAPNSGIENMYGPTEVACSCACYRWDPVTSPEEVYRGMVPIGYPNPGMTALVADENLREVAPGESGELLMAGPQVVLGYLNDPEKTKRAFMVPPGRNEVYYRTGDLVRRPNGDGPLVFLGRLDLQIKVLGHRVELGEVEAVVREESGGHGVAAFGWPVTADGAQGIEVFVEHANIDVADLKRKVSARLPGFMVPKRFHLVPRFPLNENGKCDRKALRRLLEDGI